MDRLSWNVNTIASIVVETEAIQCVICRKGEDVLRKTGLGYTIVRPGPLLEEPGGYKALVFDQGNRITQSISIADVADVSLKVGLLSHLSWTLGSTNANEVPIITPYATLSNTFQPCLCRLYVSNS